MMTLPDLYVYCEHNHNLRLSYKNADKTQQSSPNPKLNETL